MADIRLVAFDLDGTLLTSRQTIPDDARAAIAGVRARGIDVMLVTGRHHVMAYPYHHALGLDTPAICCNGTYLYDYAGRDAIVSRPLSAETAGALVRWARDEGLHALVYVDDAMVAKSYDAHLDRLREWANDLPDAVRPTIRLARGDFGNEIAGAKRIWKLVVSHPEPAWIADSIARLPAGLALSCEWSWRNRVDIAAAGNSKGARLAEYAAMRGWAPENVLAFGDHMNDISMLRWAGTGVAMGNAEDEVKAAADLVTGSNDDSGIASMLGRLLPG
ncbi:pyridoxal phosphatase [Jeongeupia sp. USM3]|uniref:pyridoxal phosphatase n=1 Tax=Jeongeupia sp. USM3 TaxID=1906741 RepID=UPI00089DF74E|nr:pyridoxal phosphatase [Jeongeupia sp. USM3]AOY01111.1 hypothetical protein BJP62_12045 [Jeongeupia sp. USM3]